MRGPGLDPQYGKTKQNNSLVIFAASYGELLFNPQTGPELAGIACDLGQERPLLFMLILLGILVLYPESRLLVSGLPCGCGVGGQGGLFLPSVWDAILENSLSSLVHWFWSLYTQPQPLGIQHLGADTPS